jgi:signal peptidase II
MILILAVAITIFAADFIIKNFLLVNYPFVSIPLIKDFLHITVIINRGAAFGILNQYTNLLVYLGVIFIAFLLWFAIRKKRKSIFDKIVFGLILGGALSNLFDRFFYGFVVDYIDIRVWPVFNLSDLCITSGIILIIFQSLKLHEKEINC